LACGEANPVQRSCARASSFVPAKGTRGKQDRLGVEDWDLTAKTKPPARRITFRRDQMLCHGDYCLGRGGRKTRKDIFQRHWALRVGARAILNQIDGGASCLRAKRGFDVGSGGRAVRHGQAPEKARPPMTGMHTYVKVLLPMPKAYFRCH
jgi:hypothetical protein